MGNLTKNFNREEYACPHGADNVDPWLAKAMQEYRDLLGVPIKITSACRCEQCGPDQGYHLASESHPGRAADSIVLGGKDLLAMYTAALQVQAFREGGIGIYPYDNPLQGFVHLDVRNGCARWARVKGQYVSHQEGLDYIYVTLITQGYTVGKVDSMQPNGLTYQVPVVHATPVA